MLLQGAPGYHQDWEGAGALLQRKGPAGFTFKQQHYRTFGNLLLGWHLFQYRVQYPLLAERAVILAKFKCFTGRCRSVRPAGSRMTGSIGKIRRHKPEDIFGDKADVLKPAGSRITGRLPGRAFYCSLFYQPFARHPPALAAQRQAPHSLLFPLYQSRFSSAFWPF